MGIEITTKEFEKGFNDLERWNFDLSQRISRKQSSLKGKRCPHYNKCDYHNNTLNLSDSSRKVYEIRFCMSNYNACTFYQTHKENINKSDK